MNSNRLNILLIGGSGFVSGTLARLAIEAGHQVWAVTRGQRQLPEGVTSIIVDRHDQQAFQEKIAQVGVRWDLAVDVIGYAMEDAQQDVAVFGRLAQHLVFISTDFVYDPVKRTFPQSPDQAAYITEGYGGQKRACELEIMAHCPPGMAWTILRPTHIYGPGSLLGCLPDHGRDKDLLRRLRAGETLRLVGGGHFLQQPIFARDLAETILSCAGNGEADHQIFNMAGPDIIESREFYRIIADILKVELHVEELPVQRYWEEHPDKHSFLCHRFYDLTKLRDHRLNVPQTRIADGLRQQVAFLERQAS